MLAEQEEFTAQMELSLDILNDVCDKAYSLYDTVDGKNEYQRVAKFLKLDTKIALNELELWGSTLDSLQKARDRALEAVQAISTIETQP
jgi:hypothetical protein